MTSLGSKRLYVDVSEQIFGRAKMGREQNVPFSHTTETLVMQAIHNIHLFKHRTISANNILSLAIIVFVLRVSGIYQVWQ